MTMKNLLHLILPLIITCVITFFFWIPGIVQDDAFITFRVAHNLADGFGPYYNSTMHEEVSTTPAFVVISALFIKLGLDPIFSTRVLNLLAALLLVFLAWLWERKANENGVLLAPWMMAFSALLATNTASCMETTSYAACAALTIYLACQKKAFLSGLTGGLLVWLRPDGVLFLLPALLILLIEDKRIQLKPSLQWLCGLLPFIALLIFWKLSFYNNMLPNTFYVKGRFQLAVLMDGWGYIRNLLLVSGFIWVLVLVFWGLISSYRKWVAFIVILMLHALYYLYIGGDFIRIYRFGLPIVIFLCLGFSAGFSAFKKVLVKKYRLLPIFFLLVYVVSNILTFEIFFSDYYSRSSRGYIIRCKELAVFLDNEAGDRNKLLIGLQPAGCLPYYSQQRFVDYGSLSDRSLAMKSPVHAEAGPGHGCYDAKLILSRKPDLLLIGKIMPLSEPQLSPMLQVELDILAALEEEKASGVTRYRTVSWRTEDDKYYVMLVKIDGKLKDWLENPQLHQGISVID